MHDLFSSFCRPSNRVVQQLWQYCLFVCDSSVLLDLYRYSKQTRNEVLRAFGERQHQLWIPHQVGYEYMRYRVDAILQRQSRCEQARNVLPQIVHQAESTIQEQFELRFHRRVDVDELIDSIRAAVDACEREVDIVEMEEPNLLESDTILDALTALFRVRIGPPFTPGQLEAAFQEGRERFHANIPPGFELARRRSQMRGNEKYSDWIIWKQIIIKAAIAKRPVILICNETKADWWWKSEHHLLGPRPELVEEIKEKANVPFHIYHCDQFLELAAKCSDAQISQATIEEVRGIREDALQQARDRHALESASRMRQPSPRQLPPQTSQQADDFLEPDAEVQHHVEKLLQLCQDKQLADEDPSKTIEWNVSQTDQSEKETEVLPDQHPCSRNGSHPRTKNP